MKVSALRELSDKELQEKVIALKEELFNLRFQAATGQLENPMQAKTVIRERELANEAN